MKSKEKHTHEFIYPCWDIYTRELWNICECGLSIWFGYTSNYKGYPVELEWHYKRKFRERFPNYPYCEYSQH